MNKRHSIVLAMKQFSLVEKISIIYWKNFYQKICHCEEFSLTNSFSAYRARQVAYFQQQIAGRIIEMVFYRIINSIRMQAYKIFKERIVLKNYLLKNILVRSCFTKVSGLEAAVIKTRLLHQFFLGMFQTIFEMLFRRIFARNSHSEIFYKEGVVIEKRATFLKIRLRHRYCSANFAKFF